MHNSGLTLFEDFIPHKGNKKQVRNVMRTGAIATITNVTFH